MKKTVIIIMSFFMLGIAKAQIIPTSNASLEATAQSQTGIQASMKAAMSTMEKIQKYAEKIQKSAKYVNSLESARELLSLIDNTICTYKNLDRLISVNASGNFCGFSFNQNVANLQLQAAIDVVGLVISSGISMEQAGRAGNFAEAIKLFKEANQTLGHLTNAVTSYNFNIAMQKQAYKDSRQINLMSRYTNNNNSSSSRRRRR